MLWDIPSINTGFQRIEDNNKLILGGHVASLAAMYVCVPVSQHEAQQVTVAHNVRCMAGYILFTFICSLHSICIC